MDHKSPFDLGSSHAYSAWRDAKLRDYPASAAEVIVPVEDVRHLMPDEHQRLRDVCAKTNFVIYQSRQGGADKDIPRALGAQYGLTRLDDNMLADDDAVTSLRHVADKSGRGYIPYSNKRLLWHTDGYYNPPARRIRAFLLHCVSPAESGGDNALLDHEIAYIRLRDADPAYIQALMEPDAMTIPPNTEAVEQTRAAETGPVFSVDPETGCLHMRYTSRTRSIVWKDDPATRAAVAFLESLLAGEEPCVFHHRLAANEGILCNNVLHNRSAFEDNVQSGRSRLLYRARYYDRIAGTRCSI